MSAPRIYLLDGQPCNVRKLCVDRHWPRAVVTEALRSSSTMTTDELRQLVVSHRSQPVVRVIPEVNRKRNAINGETYLTKQARSKPIRYGSGVL